MRAEGICASLRETLLVLIYTSMTTAQNELTVSGGQQQPKSKKLEKYMRKSGLMEAEHEGADGRYSSTFFTVMLQNICRCKRRQTKNVG